MVDKELLRQAKRKRIIKAKKSIELQTAEDEIDDNNIKLTPDEEKAIDDIAESESDKKELRTTAIAAKKHKEAVKLAKKKVNAAVPSKHLIQRPGYGESSAVALLHSHEAYRFLLGRNQRMIVKDGQRIRQTSIIGLFEAAAHLNTIYSGYQSGCPYAKWTLVKIEEQIKNIRKLISEAKAAADELRKAATLIDIKLFNSKNPSEISLDFKSIYAYHFADLLLQYDMILRTILTHKIKHFISIKDYKAIEKKVGRPLRNLYRLTANYRYVGAESVKQQNAKLQDAEYRMGVLPKAILSGELEPEFVSKIQGTEEDE